MTEKDYFVTIPLKNTVYSQISSSVSIFVIFSFDLVSLYDDKCVPIGNVHYVKIKLKLICFIYINIWEEFVYSL